jgi:hypothetical protein
MSRGCHCRRRRACCGHAWQTASPPSCQVGSSMFPPRRPPPPPHHHHLSPPPVSRRSQRSPLSSSKGCGLFLTVEDSVSYSNLCLSLSLDAILWRRESLERERVIGCTNERVIGRSAIYSRCQCIFKEMPLSWGVELQIHSSNRLMTSYPWLH